MTVSRRPRRVAAVLLATLPFALVAHPLAAQSHAVVQALPPPASADLSRALQRLARTPGDFDALVAAGKASLALNDIDAAIGFFSRADAVRAGDPQVKAGLASANLRSGRPIEALELFNQALAAGAPPASIAADRGLAFDLVGDGVSAQAQYRIALGYARDDETLRRLGLSQAIAGDQRGFEATLLPLLEKRDLAAYRARAFGLAILGREDDAVAIADAVMPREMASRMAPYLRYMPKLTHAQQAAAANLGNFPRAAQIGRDDPRFAAYSSASNSAPPGASDARLAPTGAPLGARSAANTTDSRSRRRASSSPPPAATLPPPPPSPPPATVAAAIQSQRGIPRRAERVTPSPPSPPPVQVKPAPTPAPTPAPAIVITPPPPPPPPPPPAPAIELPPVQEAPRPVVVAQMPPSSAASVVERPATQLPPVVIVPVPREQTPAPAEPASVADAFADLGQASAAKAPASGAVDITAIKPKIERPEPPKSPPPPPPPPKPKIPSRVWVQVATGRDVKALGFDWRKFAKAEPKLLGKRDAYTAKWGQTRRLVTGPFESDRAASQFVAQLKKAGIDAFVFTSDEGEDVAPLK